MANVDGSRLIKASLSGPVDSTEDIGVKLAENLIAQGADKILAELSTLEH